MKRTNNSIHLIGGMEMGDRVGTTLLQKIVIESVTMSGQRINNEWNFIII